MSTKEEYLVADDPQPTNNDGTQEEEVPARQDVDVLLDVSELQEVLDQAGRQAQAVVGGGTGVGPPAGSLPSSASEPQEATSEDKD